MSELASESATQRVSIGLVAASTWPGPRARAFPGGSCERPLPPPAVGHREQASSVQAALGGLDGDAACATLQLSRTE
jgi:hypothetical protein